MKTNYKPRGVSEKLDMSNNNNIIDLFYKKNTAFLPFSC